MSSTSSPSPQNRAFALRSGAAIRAGWLGEDIQFLTRSLRFLLRPQGEAVRGRFALEAGDIGVLAVIGANPGVSQNDLAASLVLKKSAVTRVVQRLEKRGFVARQRSTLDRRANCLTLTGPGAALTDAVREATRMQQAHWFDGIDPARAEAFFDVMHLLLARLAEAGGDDGADDD